MRKGLHGEIQETIDLGKRNLEKIPYLNWCRHLRIDEINRSPLGLAVGLPIGLHHVHCAYYNGSQGIDVKMIAQNFIAENCSQCPYHDELSAENAGRDIVAAAKKREFDLHEQFKLREELIQRVKSQPPQNALEKPDIDDSTLEALITLLDDDKSKKQAIERIVSAAKTLPLTIFSHRSVKVLSFYVTDQTVGEECAEALHRLGQRNSDYYSDFLESVRSALSERKNVEKLSLIVAEYVKKLGKIEPLSNALETLFDYLSDDYSFRLHDNNGATVLSAIDEIAILDLSSVQDQILNRIHTGKKVLRIGACRVLQHLFERSIIRDPSGFIEPLLKSFETEDDQYGDSADFATLRTLAQAYFLDKSALDQVEKYFDAAAPEIKPLIFRLYHVFIGKEVDSATIDCFIKNAVVALNGDQDPEFRSSALEFLQTVCRRKLLPFDYFEVLVGILVVLTNDLEARKSIKEPQSGVALRKIQEDERVLQGISATLESLAQTFPLQAFKAIGDLFDGLSSKQHSKLKGNFLKLLVEASKEDFELEKTCLPLVFGSLVDQESVAIRGAAVNACVELRDILPDDVVFLLRQMLFGETYLYVGSRLVNAVQAIPAISKENPVECLVALLAWEKSFDSGYDKENVFETVVSLAYRHPEVRPAAFSFIKSYCYHREFWTRKNAVERIFYLAREDENFAHLFIEAALDFYKFFQAEANDFNGLNEPYEHLLSFPESILMRHKEKLVEVAKLQSADMRRNKGLFGFLSEVNEFHAEAAEIFRDYSDSFPDEPRFEGIKKYFRALYMCEQAEASLEIQNMAKALELFENAESVLKSANDSANDEQDPISDYFLARASFIRAVNAYDVTKLKDFISRLQDVRQIYADLQVRHEEIRADEDDLLSDSFTSLSNCLLLLSQGLDAELSGLATRDQLFIAAHSNLQKAISLAERTRYDKYRAALKKVLLVFPSGLRISEFDEFYQIVKAIPFPPILKESQRFRSGRKQIARFKKSHGVHSDKATMESTETPVAYIELSVDRSVLRKTIAIQAGYMYDLRAKIHLSRWPAEFDRFTIDYVSASYDLNQGCVLTPFTLERPTDGQIEFDRAGRVMFENPLTLLGSPIVAKVIARFVSESSSQQVDLFGTTSISIRTQDRKNLQAATGYTAMDERLLEIIDQLDSDIPDLDPAEKEALINVLNIMLNYAGQNFQEPFFKKDSFDAYNERDFERSMNIFLKQAFGEKVKPKDWAGGGPMDVRVLGIPVEYKVEKYIKSREKMRKNHIGQIAAYESGSANQVGVLCIFDATEKVNALAHPKNDITLDTPLLHGYEESDEPPVRTRVLALIIPVNVPTPSSLPPAEFPIKRKT